MADFIAFSTLVDGVSIAAFPGDRKHGNAFVITAVTWKLLVEERRESS
jgi:hypothetical protein